MNLKDTEIPGQRLKTFLSKIDLQQKEFAGIIGSTPSHVTRLLKGILRLEPYIQIIYELGCDLNWLFTGNGEMFAKNETGEFLSQREIKEKEAELKIILKIEEDKKYKEIMIAKLTNIPRVAAKGKLKK